MLITNAKVITWEEENRILEGAEVLVQDGLIRQIGKSGSLQKNYPEEEVLDAGGQYLMPGNICAHTHFYGAFSRGMAIPGDPATDFVQILQKLWWKLDKALDEDSVRYSALTLLADAIRHGTTTLFDHHASPNCIDGSLDVIAEAVRQSGLRASLCYEVTDRDGEERAKAGIAENMRFIRKVQSGAEAPLLRAHFGLHASLTIGPETLERCVAENNGRVGFHVHVAEGISDQEDSMRRYGMRVIPRLQKAGVLLPSTILAHGVHTQPEEWDLIANSKSWLSHQPRSNMNNAVGVAPVEEMIKNGVNVCMGNDGFSNAMWSEWFASYLIHKDHSGDPRAMNGYTIIEMAIHNNSQLVTQTFDSLRIGVLEEGAAADLILVDYHPITPLSAGNLPWHILFGFREGLVSMTMVAGKLLMRDHKLITLDEAEISAKARECALRTWKGVEKYG